MSGTGRRRTATPTSPPGSPAAFAGSLITDGYTGYQHRLQRLAGIQQCCARVIRRSRAVTKFGPGGLQSWAGDIIAATPAFDPQMLAQREPPRLRARLLALPRGHRPLV